MSDRKRHYEIIDQITDLLVELSNLEFQPYVFSQYQYTNHTKKNHGFDPEKNIVNKYRQPYRLAYVMSEREHFPDLILIHGEKDNLNHVYTHVPISGEELIVRLIKFEAEGFSFKSEECKIKETK